MNTIINREKRVKFSREITSTKRVKTKGPNGSLKDSTAESLWRGASTVKLNELQKVGELASNPVKGHATCTIVFEFVKQNVMIDGIKGLGREIKENTNGMFIAIESKGDFFI